MLWNNSHETWSDFLVRCYAQSRNKEGLSKEAAADRIVSIHNANGGPEKTGQHFDPASVTEANRLKANCMTLDRVIEKDLFNVLPYLLAGMSNETKLAFAAQYFHAAGLGVHLLSEDDEEGHLVENAVETQMIVNKACNSMLDAALDPTPQNLDAAEREAVQVIEKFKRTRALFSKFRRAGGVLGRFIHPKREAA